MHSCSKLEPSINKEATIQIIENRNKKLYFLPKCASLANTKVSNILIQKCIGISFWNKGFEDV